MSHSEVVESTCWRAAATRGWIWGGPPDERHWHTTFVFDMHWYASMEEVDLLTSPVAKVSAVWRHRNLRLAYIAQHHFFHLSEFLKSTPLHYFQVRFRLWIFFGCLKRFMWWCFWCFSLSHPKQMRLEELTDLEHVEHVDMQFPAVDVFEARLGCRDSEATHIAAERRGGGVS